MSTAAMPGTLDKYIAKFRKLRRAPGKKGSDSTPHKPVLLLAVIESFERGEISGNQVPLTEQLVITFKEVWRLLAKDTQFVPNIAMPFYHLKTEGFWTLVIQPGMEESFREFAHTPTLSWLDRHILYASLPDDLAVLLASPVDRAKLRHDLLVTYFPTTRKAYRLAPALAEDETLETIELEILELSATDYAARMRVYQQEQKEIQIFLRSRIFQRLIPQTYDHRCAVTGWRVHNAQHAMIDACHIIPFAESQNDHISNGISLSPTLHRAFDRGLIAVDDDYRVLVRPGLVESGAAFSLGAFKGRKLHLPALTQYHPSLENLKRHRERFGF
jgi:putative restriction endonuclease